MKKKIWTVLLIWLVSLSFLAIYSCKKEKVLATGMDAQMYVIATDELKDYAWYKNSPDLLPKSSGSGHNFPYLRTRYNIVLLSQLDSIGKLKNSAVFAEGSMIVKELYDKDRKLQRYAILYKQSLEPEADANGWVWGYINADKTVAEPSANKGEACSGCHGQAGNIQNNLMQLYFP